MKAEEFFSENLSDIYKHSQWIEKEKNKEFHKQHWQDINISKLKVQKYTNIETS